MNATIFFWGMLSLTSSVCYYGLAVWLWRNLEGRWMHICLTVLATLAGTYSLIGGVSNLLDYQVPRELYKIMRILSGINGITAMLALRGVLHEARKGK